jgi:hypothetical protein
MAFEMSILFENIINHYNGGRLTKNQLIELSSAFGDGSFRKNVSKFFSQAHLDEVLRHFDAYELSITQSVARKERYFTYKVDLKNLRTSLQNLYDLGTDAYKDTRTKHEITVMAISMALTTFPKRLRYQLIDYKLRYESFPALNQTVLRRLDWATFVDKSEEYQWSANQGHIHRQLESLEIFFSLFSE